ncbi:26S proteasome non-ATPase regulatory subunit 12 [Geodia barretti]|uniref:26S proteasome non-ATPase regulatory subunit 12 n=1 Tax=Geodia barretti TaxID=519541 RepID=A0AA35T0Z6_GEOBA|nr:26S proteasome non-ATPase regulatory subunit 12 [Geodia barretti]
MVLYVLLAPYDHEQSDLLHRVHQEKKLEKQHIYMEVLECFKRRELLQWTEFLVKYEEVLREGMPDCSATEVFVSDTELGKHQWEDLRKRVIEHTPIRVVAQYYTRRITMQRLIRANLTLHAQESEEFLTQLVIKKTIYARIDRPAGVVNFREVKDPNEVLNEWSRNLSNL